MNFWFESHATSIDNELGLASGHCDVPLSRLGRAQARQLGERYRERPISSVYTSDLSRARETAEIAFAGRSFTLVSDVRLRECDYGTWSRCSVEQLDAARLQFVEDKFPGGESYRDVVHRMETFLASLPREDGQVVLIGHRATWYALEHLLRERDLHEIVSAPWRWQPDLHYLYAL